MRPAARVLRVGFACGYYTKENVASWADEEIASEDAPRIEIIELCLVKHKGEHELSMLLGSIGGPLDPSGDAELRIAFIGRMHARGRIELGAAVSMLYALACEDALSRDAEGLIRQIDAGYDLALAGAHGTVDQVARDLGAFAAPYEHLLPAEE